MRDGAARPGTPPELLSFSDWAAIATAARDAIDASPLVADVTLKGETDEVKAEVKKLRDEIKWVWPKIREHLTKCGVLIGPSGIEIRPYHPPTALNTGYSHARQRIYLSATLGSMDDLQRRVGGGQVTRLVTAQPLPAGTTGERMFVLNPSPAEALDPDVLDWALSGKPTQPEGRRPG